MSLFQRLICTQKYAIGTSETSVPIREVPLFQRLICTQKYAIGTSETSVPIRERDVPFQRLICAQEYTIGTSYTVLVIEVSLFQRLICTQKYTTYMYMYKTFQKLFSQIFLCFVIWTVYAIAALHRSFVCGACLLWGVQVRKFASSACVITVISV